MSAALSPEELAMFKHIPDDELVELAVQLDLVVPETIDRAALLERAVEALIEVAKRDGLPLSAYDKDDLEALPKAHLRALAALCGTSASVDALIKRGRKSYKRYRAKALSPIPMVTPMLLPAIARCAFEREV